MEYDRNKNEFTCPDWKKLKYKYTKTGYPQRIRIYESEDCRKCEHKEECTKAKGNRRIQFNKKLWY